MTYFRPGDRVSVLATVVTSRPDRPGRLITVQVASSYRVLHLGSKLD